MVVLNLKSFPERHPDGPRFYEWGEGPRVYSWGAPREIPRSAEKRLRSG
jgi:hypothetical protein